MKRVGKRIRLVGAGVVGMKGGDACVAPVLLCQCITPPTKGDASVPSPTGMKRSSFASEASFTRKVYYVRKEGYLYVRYNIEQAESFRSLERIG